MTLATNFGDGFNPGRPLAQYTEAQLTAVTKALLNASIEPNLYTPEVLFACGKICVTSSEISDGLAARMRIYDMILTHPAASDLHRTRVAIADIDMIRRTDTPDAATTALRRLDDIPQPPEHFPAVRAEWFQVAAMCHDVRFK